MRGPMSAVRRPRRSRLVSSAAFVLALVTLGALWNLVFPTGGARAANGNPDPNSFTAAQVKDGAQLFAEGCASCHGSAGQGGLQGQAPSLIGVGAAAADFQLTTGRMPLKGPAAQAPQKPVQYSPDQVLALDAYIASLGAGPEIPSVDPASGDIAVGGQLFRANCANCHNFAGQGNVLSGGKYAPNLTHATDLQVAEAIRTGPESMPKFATTQLSQTDVNSMIKYIQFLRAPQDPGGHGLGHLGPVSEGLVIFLVGIAGLALVCLWIGERAKA